MADGQSTGETTPRPLENDANKDSATKEKGKKRSLFGLGKKKEDSNTAGQIPSPPKETSQLSSATNRSATSPHPPASPNRALSGESPRLASPARSQIFERDVQDSTVLQPNSPAIPTHIQTENHIPPVLDDASEAITNNKLDPDSVEIVTHNSHQPAAVTVTGTSPPGVGTPAEQPPNPDWTEELHTFANRESAVAPDNASNYGSLDSADVRRLSFISFADVVQSEHTSVPGASGSRDNIHMAGLTSLPSAGLNRSPSPIRSPVSSPGIGSSPPTSNPGSIKGLEISPARKPLGSPGSGSNLAPTSGDLNIETMSQALRRTTSSDLSNVRSIPTSPIESSGPKELPVVR